MKKLPHIIVCGPSGTGKTSIVSELMKHYENLCFSVSGTTRQKTEKEIHGKDYFFFKIEDFLVKIEDEEFAEWQQVYKGDFYGTLKSEIERIEAEGKSIIFDVDVNGALNLKKYFGTKAVTMFIKPCSLQSLEKRLIERKRDTLEKIKKRLKKAEKEIEIGSYNCEFIIVNEDGQQEKAIKECIEKIERYSCAA